MSRCQCANILSADKQTKSLLLLLSEDRQKLYNGKYVKDVFISSLTIVKVIQLCYIFYTVHLNSAQLWAICKSFDQNVIVYHISHYVISANAMYFEFNFGRRSYYSRSRGKNINVKFMSTSYECKYTHSMNPS